MSYIVTAEDGSKKTYAATVTISNVTCTPAILAGLDDYLHITYNEDGTVDKVETEQFDSGDFQRVFQYTYSAGKVSRIDVQLYGQFESYTTYEYLGNKTRERYYGKNATNDIVLKYYTNVYEQDGRITSKAAHFYNSETGQARQQDSLVYTYDVQGNISRQDSYENEEISFYYLQKYDNNVNPFYGMNVAPSVDKLFDVAALSPNNITEWTLYYDDEPEVREFEYTYTNQNTPATRKGDGMYFISTYDYTYSCH